MNRTSESFAFCLRVVVLFITVKRRKHVWVSYAKKLIKGVMHLYAKQIFAVLKSKYFSVVLLGAFGSWERV